MHEMTDEELAEVIRTHEDLFTQQLASSIYANRQRDKYSKELLNAAAKYNSFPLDWD